MSSVKFDGTQGFHNGHGCRQDGKAARSGSEDEAVQERIHKWYQVGIWKRKDSCVSCIHLRATLII
jgi:hypothetical protein